MGSGCKNCPVSGQGCDTLYRGSHCAAMRARAGVDFDPKTNSDNIRSLSDVELAIFLAGICHARDEIIKQRLQKAGYTGVEIFFETPHELQMSHLRWLETPMCQSEPTKTNEREKSTEKGEL